MKQRLLQKFIIGVGLAVAFMLVFLLGRQSAMPHGETLPAAASSLPVPVAVRSEAVAIAEATPSAPLPVPSPEPSPRAAANRSSARVAAVVTPTLEGVSGGLEMAKRALGAATTKNHGGYIELARADITSAQKRFDAVSAFASAHPQSVLVPPELSADSRLIAARIAEKSFPTPNSQGHLVAALNGLKMAAQSLETSSGGSLDGNRDKLFTDLDHTFFHLITAFDFLHTGGIPKADTTPADLP